MGETLFVEKYGETLFRQSGWTPTAELINGRCARNWLRVGGVEHAQRGRVDGHLHAPALGGVDGCCSIAGASIVPVVEPQGYFPPALKDGVMGAYKEANLDEKFTPTVEMVNGSGARWSAWPSFC